MSIQIGGGYLLGLRPEVVAAAAEDNCHLSGGYLVGLRPKVVKLGFFALLGIVALSLVDDVIVVGLLHHGLRRRK